MFRCIHGVSSVRTSVEIASLKKAEANGHCNGNRGRVVLGSKCEDCRPSSLDAPPQKNIHPCEAARRRAYFIEIHFVWAHFSENCIFGADKVRNFAKMPGEFGKFCEIARQKCEGRSWVCCLAGGARAREGTRGLQ